MNQEKVVEMFGTLSVISGQLCAAASTNATVNGTEVVLVNADWMVATGRVIMACVSELTKQVFGQTETSPSESIGSLPQYGA